MSVVDDLKNTFGNSDSSSSSDSSRGSSRSDFQQDNRHNSPDFDSGSLDSDNFQESNTNLRDKTNTQDNFNRHGNNRESRGNNVDRNQNQLNKQRSNNPGNNFPNGQAGRPQEGSSSPQVSSRTERKMENAGLNRNSSQNPQGSNDRQKNDFQELKSQNEEIINLLKQINRNLERLGR